MGPMPTRARSSVPPVAVVALGDLRMGDDGVALRVMGRVRPLLGEIALTGCEPTPDLPKKGSRRIAFYGGSGDGSRRVLTRKDLQALAARRAASKGPKPLCRVVDWVEGRTSIEAVRPHLRDRKRVVLIDAIATGVSPGTVRHWHLERTKKRDLSVIRFYQPVPIEAHDHLCFWMEDDLPPHGTDLIAIEPYRIAPGDQLSAVLRSRLAAITSQVGGLLLRILEEEGWRFDEEPRPARRGASRTA